MKKVLILTCVVFFVAAVAFAAGPKTYQVTGPVLEVTADVIAVQKGKDRWEIARDAATKVTGDLKVGSKVTIEYTMKAVTAEVKDAKKAEPKEAKKEAPKKK
ncbi:MAG: hypothetical protein PHP66_10450 [Syntrophales bacterium]|nr:hypothetical protein [Syntrophales bacterium]